MELLHKYKFAMCCMASGIYGRPEDKILKIPDYKILLLGKMYDKKELLGMCVPPHIRDGFMMDYDPYKMKAVVTGRTGQKAEAGYHQEQARIMAETNLLPDMVQIDCEPKDEAADGSGLNAAGDYDKLMVVTSWQFESGYLEALLQAVCSQRFRYPMAEVCLILLKSRIKTAATDLNNQDYVIARVYENYKNMQDIRVSVLQEGDSLFRLIHPCRNIVPVYFADRYLETFRNWKIALTDKDVGFLYMFSEIEIVPDILEEKLQPAYLEKHICGLHNLKFGENAVKSFYDNFYTECYQGVQKKILDYYQETVKNVCVWDMEQDLEEIKQQMRRLYALRAGRQAEKKYRVPRSQTEYNQLEQNTNIKTAFYESVTEYYKKDVAQYLYEHLCDKACKIIKLLQKIYKENVNL